MISFTFGLLILIAAAPSILMGHIYFWYVWIKPMKPPADTSNRQAHNRLVWNALRHPEKFTELFPDLKMDEGDNFKNRK
jgi:hypothetical protein